MFTTPIDHPFQIHHPLGYILGAVFFLIAVGIKYNAYTREKLNPILGLLFYKGGQPFLSKKERVAGSILLSTSVVSGSLAFVREIQPDHIIEEAGIFLISYFIFYFAIFYAKKV